MIFFTALIAPGSISSHGFYSPMLSPMLSRVCMFFCSVTIGKEERLCENISRKTGNVVESGGD
jgi:hypothetical protein